MSTFNLLYIVNEFCKYQREQSVVLRNYRRALTVSVVLIGMWLALIVPVT